MKRNQLQGSLILRLSLLLLLAVPCSFLWMRRGPGSEVRAQAIVSKTGLRSGFVGDEACASCHRERSLSFKQTSHHLTSQFPGTGSIFGSYVEGKNILTIESPETSDAGARLFFEMTHKDGGYYQAAIAEREGKRLTHEERIDLVLGSGTRGQTYLYWSGSELFELPVSYWKDGDQWINSPGYKDGAANFRRHVDPRCLECHSTFIQPLSSDPQTNLYNRSSLQPGISCESCHGPGAAHVAAESSPAAKQAKPAGFVILNPARFVRDRQIDQCALCHNGTERAETAPAFSYLPGQDLDKFLAPNPADSTDRPDVHGNQVGLLKRSRCFRASPSMSCSTCHNVHQPERSPAEYSDRCLSCHAWQSCGLSRTMGVRIKQDCINCHMPLQQTGAIVSVTAGRVLRTSIRTHWIKVYPRVPSATSP